MSGPIVIAQNPPLSPTHQCHIRGIRRMLQVPEGAELREGPPTTQDGVQVRHFTLDGVPGARIETYTQADGQFVTRLIRGRPDGGEHILMAQTIGAHHVTTEINRPQANAVIVNGQPRLGRPSDDATTFDLETRHGCALSSLPSGPSFA